MPFPNEETTPPVTKMYFVSIKCIYSMDCKGMYFCGIHSLLTYIRVLNYS